MQRFTVYRTSINERGSHTHYQMNADDVPQFEGVIWSDKTVTIRWLTPCRSTSVWATLEDMLNVHGHPEYNTVIQWHDGDVPLEWTHKVNEYNMTLAAIAEATK